MNSPDNCTPLQQIKKMQEYIAVVIGSIFALTMCVYFFTYAMLVDKGISGGLWIMGISSIVMLLMLIKLKQVSFFVTRLLIGRRTALRDTFATLTAADL